MIDAQPQHAPDVAPPAVATGEAAVDHEPDPGALPRSRALAAQQAAAAAPVALSRAARQLSEAASAAVADEAAMPALADALRVMAQALVTGARDPERPKIADDCGQLADAIANATGANADELRAKRADAILDPALHARERIQSLQRLLPHLRDGELEAAIGPLGSAISLLIQFGDKHAPPRFHTDLYAIESAANKLFTKVQSIANSSSFMHATDALFEPFDRLYRALEQAEPEVEQARALIVALQALEAAITQGRKRNDYAKAATAALDAFCDGLWTLTSRGPYGTSRAVSSIQSPFKRALGYLEETGTVLGGETRSGAEAYRRRVDKPEDVEATRKLIESHAPPKPDTREPAADWIVALARSAEDWLGAMRQSAHPRMSRPSAKLVEERTLAFRKLLEAAIPTFPAAQQMAWKVSGISECIGRPELLTSLAGSVTEAEAARKVLWTQANAFALDHGPADAEQNLTFAWLAALDRDLAAGIGWGYFKTPDGQQASRLHDKQVDRSIDEWNTPEDKPPPPVTQLQVTTQLLEAARVAVEDPAAMPGLVTALQRFSTVIAAASHDPARTEIAKQCAAMATALAAVQGATPDELRARRGDAIVDPAARIREQLESLRTLQPHLNDPDLDRALDPMANAFSLLLHFGSTNAPPRFQTDVDLLVRATSKWFTRVHDAANAYGFDRANDKLFEPFDGLYRALEQAEAEIPEARPLIAKLEALEAAITQGRKPNPYATAAEPAVDAFLQGLSQILARGPYGTSRATSEVSSSLKRGLGYLEAYGTVLGGETREGAEAYARRVDPPEDAKATTEPHARHHPAPPEPDHRAPPPAWAPPLEAAARGWLDLMRALGHPQMSHRRDETRITAVTGALVQQLQAVTSELPSAQTLAWRLKDITECMAVEKLAGLVERFVGEAETARKAVAAEAEGLAQKAGPLDAEQNLTFAWLAAIDARIAEGIGWGYRTTSAGEAAARLHPKQLDRSIDAWNTPDAPPAPPISLAKRSQELYAATQAGLADPSALPALATALHAEAEALTATAHDPSRPKLAAGCTAIASAVEAAQSLTGDAQRTKLADGIVDPALRAVDELELLRTLLPHLGEPDLDRAIDPLRSAMYAMGQFGQDHATPRFATDLWSLARASTTLLTRMQAAVNSRQPEWGTGVSLFEPFDAIYVQLAQAEPELPSAAPLAKALHALEAALASGRKPNGYASAAEPLAQAFSTEVHALATRGFHGTGRIASEISTSLLRALGYAANVGSTLGGSSRQDALAYDRRTDPVEDPEATATLEAEHRH